MKSFQVIYAIVATAVLIMTIDGKRVDCDHCYKNVTGFDKYRYEVGFAVGNKCCMTPKIVECSKRLDATICPDAAQDASEAEYWTKRDCEKLNLVYGACRENDQTIGSDPHPKGKSTAMVIGVLVGVLVLVAIVGGLIYLFVRTRKQ